MTIEFSSLEISRLGREDNWDAQSLAEELQSLLPQLLREIPSSRIVARVSDGQPPPIDITDYTTDGITPFATFRRGPDVFNIGVGPRGELTTDAPAAAAAGGSNAFPGQVTAYLGLNLYTVTIYPSGTTNAGRSVTVLQLEGDPAFPHAVGRWATVMRCGAQYSMVIPTWG